MTSLSFPDVNVWLALLLADHVHRTAARRWWESDDAETIVFCRSTQISVLRLLTTAAAMNGKPLTMKQAWHAYDRLLEDDRVGLVREPDGMEETFRKLSSARIASPKVWADAYLTAFAAQLNATLVTFDHALESKAAHCLVLR
jgi:toxin-antitoxin system PIN domain toxin